MDKELNVQPVLDDGQPRTKRAPLAKAISVPFAYAPSDDGTDQNILILLHGLGDTHQPFAALARQLKLPQTATLALRAPMQIPYLDEPAFQWFESFDLLGELLPHPNPTPALDLLARVLAHLVEHCAWPPERVHLLGFAQGGTVAAELALRWWRAEHSAAAPRALGSVVSVSGPLLSYPNTLPALCPTPVLYFHRGASAAELAALKKGFNEVEAVRRPGQEGMPRSRDEWEPIMRFWSECLERRRAEGLYEVMNGGA